MYRCELCGVVVQSNTPALKVVLETRRKVYPERREANKIRIQGKKKPLFSHDPGGTGWEAVREAKVCRTCYDKWLEENVSPAEMAAAQAPVTVEEILETSPAAE